MSMTALQPGTRNQAVEHRAAKDTVADLPLQSQVLDEVPAQTSDLAKMQSSKEDDGPESKNDSLSDSAASAAREEKIPSKVSLDNGLKDLEMSHQAMPDFANPSDLDVDSNSAETDRDSDTDSALGDMIKLSSTASLRSSIYDHVEENGRTYHRYKAGSYMLPNDETEQNRLDMQHHLWLLTLHGQLYLAPLQPGIQNVLDVATGTGIWAIDFANKFPSANVIGTDLSPIQPDYVPSNCRFEVDDAEEDWTYSHKFDYIHGRLLISCFKSFPNFIAKAFDALQPGGYIELQDTMQFQCIDDSWEGSELQRWQGLCIEAAKNLGMDWTKTRKYKGWLEEAGFEDVVEVKLSQPSNTWAKGKHQKILGAWNNQNMTEALPGISMAVLTRGLGMTRVEIEVLLVQAKKDLSDKKIHSYMPM